MAELRADEFGFNNVPEHDEFMIDQWNSMISKRDKVYHLGDLSMNMYHGLACAKRLNGTKILIAGNHDLCHPCHHRGGSVLRKYLDVFDYVTLADEIKMAGQKVMLSHMPYDADRENYETSRYPQWRLRDVGAFLLHGHTHSPVVQTSRREIHVGFDAWKAPVNRDTIEALIRTLL